MSALTPTCPQATYSVAKTNSLAGFAPGMSSTLTEQTLAAFEAQSDSGFPADDLVDGLQTEHIYIGDESAEFDRSPATVSQRLRIRNFARGRAFELTFFEEGFLRVREGSRKRLEKDHTVDLRFIDPNPTVTRRVAMPWLWTSLGFGFAAVAALLVLPRSLSAGWSLPVTTLLGTLSMLTFLLFIYRSEERIRFVTLSGRASVVELVSSFGCLSKMRRAARAISGKSVELGQEPGPRSEQQLRAEMQAHYKLRETGVITHSACADGTAKILSRFG